MKNLTLSIILSIIAWSMSPAIPFLALDPPEVMQIFSAQVVRNTIHDGDMAILFHWYIEDNDYEQPASDTIFFRLYDTDNATLLSSAVPVVYFGYGYDNGLSCFYFTAAENLTWGENYIINITGSPAFFDPLPSPYNFIIPTDSYFGSTDQEANQEATADYIFSVAQLLEIAYPTYSLYGSTDMGIVLTDTGEAYFRSAVPGLQSMAPSLFLTQYYIPEVTPMDFDDAQAQTYAERLQGSDIMDGFNAAGDEIGISGSALVGGVFIIACIVIIIFTTRKGWGSEPGILASGIILTAGSVLFGGGLFAVRLVMGLIGAVLLFYIIAFKRA